MLSVLTKDVNLVRLLLDSEADINARNNKREQAIDLASQSNNKSIVDLINTRKEKAKIFGIF
jgi:ankyrin repeat protein